MPIKTSYKYPLTRRNFIRGSGIASGLILSSGIHSLLPSCSPQQSSTPKIPEQNTVACTPNPKFIPDLEINLQAAPKTVQILPGQMTQVWSYAATLVKGDPTSLTAVPDSYLGPIIRVQTGQRVRVNFQNKLPQGQSSIVHWHGLILPEEMDGHPRFVIEPGQTYVYETVKLNSVEQWEIINKLNPGAMMDAKGMAHPIHFHGVKFQIISRQVLPELAAGWQTVKDGYVDEGFKDTVMVMPGERVKLLMKFEKYSGLFSYHCHTLEHEDAGMMRNYRVKG